MYMQKSKLKQIFKNYENQLYEFQRSLQQKEN